MSNQQTTSKMPIVRDTLQALVAVFKHLFVLCVVLIIEVAALLFHYQSLDSAFRLMGFEQRPIREDPLLGVYLDGFFGDATLSTFGALMFAILIALTGFWLAETLFELFDAFEQRAMQRRALSQLPSHAASTSLGLEQSLASQRVQIARGIFLFVLVGGLFAAVNVLDVEMAIYRNLAGVHGFTDETIDSIEAVKAATHTIQTLDGELQSHGALFAWDAIPLIALGLLATMILAPILIEHRLHRVTARTREFVTGLCLLCAADEDEDDDGSQVPAQTAAQPQAGSTTEPLFDQALAATEPTPENPPPDQETTVEVVGSTAGERVTLDRARRHPDHYWIDPDTHEIWNADYRRQLMGG